MGRQYGLSAKGIGLLCIVATIAAILSFVSFEYSSYTSDQILRIASEDIRTNAKVQLHDLNRMLVSKMDSADTNLRFLAESPALQYSDPVQAMALLDSAQASTSEFTDAYVWINGTGRMIWRSDFNQNLYQQIKDTDLSQRQYFIHVRDSQLPFYGSGEDPDDGITRIYSARPVIGKDSGELKGVVIASIPLDLFGMVLKNELAPEFQNTFGMLDREGVILYSTDQSVINKNVYSDVTKDSLPPESRLVFGVLQSVTLEGGSGVQDIEADGARASVAFESIQFGEQQFGTLYLETPHKLADSVLSLVNQQKNITTIMMIVIGGVATALGIMIVIWNRRLEQTINVRTSELRSKSAELKKSYDSLSVAKQQLEAHSIMQEEFINTAAHELRTPTQTILGYAELLQMDPEGKTEMIEAIYRNSIRLQRLTSDILDVSRIESESLRLVKEEFSVGEAVEGVIRDAENQSGNKKIRFLYDADASIIFADKERITQVISNLLDNAIKFTRQGTIAITVYQTSGDVAVKVKDSGDGIDINIMPRLFSKFATKSEKGTGLGLFISRSIIEAHGGSMWCFNNSEGCGASFAFSLPVVDKTLEPRSQIRR